MSYRWDIDEDAVGAARREDETESRSPSARSFRPIFAGLLILLFLLLGWRYVAGRRVLAEIRRELEAAVNLEEHALVAGDSELYRRQQSLARARMLREPPGLGGERYFLLLRPPLPGLNIQDRPGTIVSLEPDTDTALGQPIRRATVSLRYVVSDSLGAGNFVESRPYVLSPKGRWIHTTPVDEDPLESDVRHPERAAGGAQYRNGDWERSLAISAIEWKGRYLRALYLPEDAERLPHVLARAEALLGRYCRAAGHCETPARTGGAQRRPALVEAFVIEQLTPIRLRFWAAVPGQTTLNRVGNGLYLTLPSPALTLGPEDEAAEDILLRQILRLGLLTIADASSGHYYFDAYGRPAEGVAGNAPLLVALMDAWLAAEAGLAVPRPADASLALQPWIGASPLLGVWTIDPRDQRVEAREPESVGAPPDATRMALTRDFAAHLAERLDSEDLARLIAGLPEAKEPELWLEGVIGETAAAIIAAWQPPIRPSPVDRALVLGCWMSQNEALLLQPGSGAAVALGREVCDGQTVSSVAWRPEGQDLAVLCGETDPRQNREGAAIKLLQDAASSRDFKTGSMPAGGDLVFPRGLHWTADGHWLLWSTSDPEDSIRTRAWAVAGAPGAWARETGRIDLGPIRHKEWAEGQSDNKYVAGLEHLSIGDHDILRPAPTGSALAVELPDGTVGVTDLPAASSAAEALPPPAPRWSVEGSDPQWSPEGDRIALIRLSADPEDPARSAARLVVLDSETGATLSEATADLPGLLIRVSQALDEGSATELVERTDIRLRVGDWSPDGRWATLAAGLRVERDDSSVDPEDGHDWFTFVAIDTRSSSSQRKVERGTLYLDAREGFVRWQDGASSALLLHVEPLWWPGGYRQDPNDPQADQLRIATRFDLDRGRTERVSVAEALRQPEALGPDSTRSPDGRWWVRPELRSDLGAPSPGRTGIFRSGENSPAWSLDVAYCSRVEWAP